MKKPLRCIFIFYMIIACAGFAQTPRYFNYSVEQGLPSSETFDVKQDSHGFIWIATDRGVVRYDGYEFKLFTTNHGLPGNTIFSIHEDYSGKIWFLGFHNRLSYYENGKIHQYKFNNVLEQHVKGTPNPRSMHNDAKTGLYIGYDLHGMVHIDPYGNFEKLTTAEAKNEKCFVRTFKEHQVYGSVAFISDSLKPPFPNVTIVQIQDGEIKNEYNYDTKKIGRIAHPIYCRRRNGNHLFSSNRIAIEFHPDLTAVEIDRKDDWICLYEDRDSCLWIASYKGGVKKLFPNSSDPGKFQFQLLANKSVTSVFQDRQGGYWFATLESGVYYFPQFQFVRVKSKVPVLELEVTAITGDGRSKIFVGYHSGRIEEIKGTTTKKIWDGKEVNNWPSNIYSLKYDSENNELWCGTGIGLYVIQNDHKTRVISPTITRAVHVSGKERFFFVGVNDFFMYNGKKISRFGLEKEPWYIEDICKDKKGRLLMATMTGLGIYNGSARLAKVPGFMGKVRIKEIHNPGNGNIIYATLGKGVVIEKNGEFWVLNEASGMASDFVNSVTSDDDTLWAATTKGISRIILKNGKATINNFDQYNGLPTNEIKKIYRQGDTVWMGTKEGLYTFRSSAIIINTKGVPVTLDQIRVNEKKVGDKNEFSASENNFSFNFFAINYKKRGNIAYRYRLVGYDNNWRYTHNRNVQYLSLPYGEYCFEVQAKNEDNYWSARSSRYMFTILKPVYLQWWFIVTVSLLVVSTVYFLVRMRITSIRRNNDMILLMNEYKGIALASQINPHFIFNSLNSIQSFILYEDRVSASRYLSSFAKLMRKSLEHSRIDFVPVRDEIELLDTYLALEQLRFKNKFGHAFVIDPSIDLSKTFIPPMIMQPFIENSIRHGLMLKKEKDGLVTIKMGFEEGFLRCEIDDNGVGRKTTGPEDREKTKHKSHGIDITVERIKTYSRNEKMKFFFVIEDKFDSFVKPAGTRVVFYLPYRKSL